MTWECFRDEAYFHLWCVRPAGERRFGYGFHVQSSAEAAFGQDPQGLEAKPASPTVEDGDAR